MKFKITKLLEDFKEEIHQDINELRKYGIYKHIGLKSGLDHTLTYLANQRLVEYIDVLSKKKGSREYSEELRLEREYIIAREKILLREKVSSFGITSIDGLTLKEISTVYGLSTPTICRIYTRAITNIKSILATTGDK